MLKIWRNFVHLEISVVWWCWRMFPKKVHGKVFSNKMISRRKEWMKPWEGEELHLCCNKVWTISWPIFLASLASINAHSTCPNRIQQIFWFVPKFTFVHFPCSFPTPLLIYDKIPLIYSSLKIYVHQCQTKRCPSWLKSHYSILNLNIEICMIP
jgi:hypothetical protein